MMSREERALQVAVIILCGEQEYLAGAMPPGSLNYIGATSRQIADAKALVEKALQAAYAEGVEDAAKVAEDADIVEHSGYYRSDDGRTTLANAAAAIRRLAQPTNGEPRR